MLNICSLIQNFFGFVKSISKKIYTSGVVIMTGAVIIAIILMNSNSFDGSGKNRITSNDNKSDEITEENDTEDSAEIQLGFENLFNDMSTEDNCINKYALFNAIVFIHNQENYNSSLAANNNEMVFASNENNQTKSKTEAVKKVTTEAETPIEIQVEAKAVTEASTEIQTEKVTEASTEIQTEAVTEASTEIQTEAVTEASTEIQTEAAVLNSEFTNLNISDSDYYWLIRIVEAEAGDQDDMGIIMVTNVIFNRVRSDYFPGTVKEVIFQNNGRTYQFEPVKNERIYDITPSDRVIECVGRAMAGEDYSQGALFFTMRTSNSSWFNRKLNLLFTHGDHYFYTY